jgi:hypothetical protein
MITEKSKVIHKDGTIGEVLKKTVGNYAVLTESGALQWWPWSECEEYHEPKTQDLIIRLTINAKDRQSLEYDVQLYDISGMYSIKEVTNAIL